MNAARIPARPGLPEWAETVRRKYVGGEASVFLLHGNVFDEILDGDTWTSLQEFIARTLLADNKDHVLLYDPCDGLSASKGMIDDRDGGLETLERVLFSKDRVAAIVAYADSVAPAGDEATLSNADRVAGVRLHRWSLSAQLAAKDNVVFLIAESLAGVNAKIVANPRVAAVEIPLPSMAMRETVIRRADPTIPPAQVARLAAHTSGLRAVHIRQILTPQPGHGLADNERRTLIVSLLGPIADAGERADKLLPLTAGMSAVEIQQLLHLSRPEAQMPDEDSYAEVLELVRRRKREIIEKECSGLIEFVDSKFDLDAVGGNTAVKAELNRIAAAIRSGDASRCPMGLLMVGPMGTGKTFVTKCFAKSSGLSAVVLKNFRSKWVGSTESNLEKVLTMVKAMGPIILIIDEGDRSFGSQSEDSDGGTSSRVVARIKEFMSDTDNRGSVLFVLMTNRPDKLDTDIKRAGRLDIKIPLFYPADTPEVLAILRSLLQRYRLDDLLVSPDSLAAAATKMIGYSNADIEAVVLLAKTMVGEGESIDAGVLVRAVDDYLPSRDTAMIDYMNLLAVFEASRRQWLPAAFRDMSAETLTAQLAEARRRCGARSGGGG
ncbi:MAG: AAA family ATPase [Dokdonella sp.]|uniref:ATP-binding protein n=1 Tax=Dokdonella sp. TaxID=2291710 RepID=UPI0032640231